MAHLRASSQIRRLEQPVIIGRNANPKIETKRKTQKQRLNKKERCTNQCTSLFLCLKPKNDHLISFLVKISFIHIVLSIKSVIYP